MDIAHTAARGLARRRRASSALLVVATLIGAIVGNINFVGGQGRQPKCIHQSARTAIAVPTPPNEGEREIVEGPDGDIIVAKQGGAYYATDAKCPHLGLPMKRGPIETIDGEVQLRCNFHNSCWKMKNGECTRWVDGAMGFQNDFIGGIMKNAGNEKSDLGAYTVTENEDGSLSLEKQ
eukprot:CAMPEP_0172724066 /NCGR_PEP_ID=MMETSP1074-20121228/85105_1 /TAXON_ID=2916 /ORGANISM="Ceratium fusus, Strain PA161109" /LENGTH=177 /DNA_ID=CAMNT_0013550429 /DNA_START=125 /DNA_END=658 /DNA_ORIENTATION=+